MSAPSRINDSKTLEDKKEWITAQIDMLWEKCPFKPKGQPFILDPDYFYDISSYKDKVIFLMKRYNLPLEEIKIYMHAGLKEPGKVILQKVFDTERLNLGQGQKIATLKNDGTFSVLDLNDSHNPKIIEFSESLPLKSINLSVFLNQDYIDSKEIMGAIIAHEVSHLYLYFSGMQKFNSSNEIEDPAIEYITDITAFVIGLGIIMLNGCRTKRKIIRQRNQIITTETKLGYLSYEQMRFVQEQILARI